MSTQKTVLEVRTRVHPPPEIYAIYGIDDNGREFGIVFNNIEDLRAATASLYKQALEVAER